MKLNRTRPFALAISLAAAVVVWGADTTSKKKPTAKPAPAKPAVPAKPAAPAEPAKAPDAAAPGQPAAPATPATAPADPKADPVAAVVNGDEIKMSELGQVLGQMLAARHMTEEDLPADQRAGVMQVVLQDVITEHVIRKACADVKITDPEVETELAKLRKDRNLTDEDISKRLATMGKTLDSLKADIRSGLKEKKWFDDQLKDKVKDATEAEAKDYYDKNAEKFQKPELVRASHILFLVDETATPEQVQAALKKAKTATERAQKEDFAKLAAELTEEPGGKERGGDLDFFPRKGMMVEPFAEAAFKLKKGEVTPEPVRTQFGYHVIKVTDRKDAEKQPFDEVKANLVRGLTEQKKREVAEGIVDDLRAKAKVDIKLPPPPPAPAPKGPAPGAGAAPAPAGQPAEAVTPPVSVPEQPPKK